MSVVFFFCRCCVETFLKNAIALPADGALLTVIHVQPLTKPALMEARASKNDGWMLINVLIQSYFEWTDDSRER